MKRLLLTFQLLSISAFSFFASSCESLPVAVAYSADIAGHEVNAAYTSGKGVMLAAKKLRVLSQK